MPIFSLKSCLAVGLASFALSVSGAGCQQAQPQPPDNSPAVAGPLLSEAAPPDAPREFRELSLAPMPEAVRIVAVLARGEGGVESREELVLLYTQAGYLGAARFFENTVRELKGQSLITAAVQNEVAWAETERDLEAHPLEVARSVAELMSQERYAAAAEMAKRDLEASGLTNQVAVQWSYAVLLGSGAPSEQVTPEALEVAFRIFLTSLEEKMTKPVGLELDSQERGYADLARVFLRRGDLASCRTAAKLALYHIKTSPDYPGRGGLMVKNLEDLINQAKSGGNP